MGITEIWRRQIFRHPSGTVTKKTPAVRLEMTDRLITDK